MSPEMVFLIFTESAGSGTVATRIFQAMAQNRINIPFLCCSRSQQGMIYSCGFDPSDFDIAMGAMPPSLEAFKVISPVGTLTFFPHQSSLTLLGRVLEAFGRATIPVHGIGTSISALTVATDHGRMDQAVTILENIMEFPPNHAPFRQEFRVRQI